MLPWLLRIWRLLPYPPRVWYLRLRYGHFAIGLAALIQDERGRILLVRRTYSRDEPWALPGGWLERSDRDMERALERELREETGLRVRVGPIRAVEKAGFAVVLLLETALLDPVAQFRRSAEVSDLKWIDPSELGKYSKFNASLFERRFLAKQETSDAKQETSPE
jgi:ADP-ribose pyrophosphatase YjhB (NUDIX family)